jgi:uncharacterized Zn ribbon protein
MKRRKVMRKSTMKKCLLCGKELNLKESHHLLCEECRKEENEVEALLSHIQHEVKQERFRRELLELARAI